MGSVMSWLRGDEWKPLGKKVTECKEGSWGLFDKPVGEWTPPLKVDNESNFVVDLVTDDSDSDTKQGEQDENGKKTLEDLDFQEMIEILDELALKDLAVGDSGAAPSTPPVVVNAPGDGDLSKGDGQELEFQDDKNVPEEGEKLEDDEVLALTRQNDSSENLSSSCVLKNLERKLDVLDKNVANLSNSVVQLSLKQADMQSTLKEMENYEEYKRFMGGPDSSDEDQISVRASRSTTQLLIGGNEDDLSQGDVPVPLRIGNFVAGENDQGPNQRLFSLPPRKSQSFKRQVKKIIQHPIATLRGTVSSLGHRERKQLDTFRKYPY